MDPEFSTENEGAPNWKRCCGPSHSPISATPPVIQINMFLNAASACVDQASAWRAAGLRVVAWSYACVSRRGAAMQQRVPFRFRARLLGRTPASHDVGGPGRCASAFNLILMHSALFKLSHFHVIRVTSNHADFRHVIASTQHVRRLYICSSVCSSR